MEWASQAGVPAERWETQQRFRAPGEMQGSQSMPAHEWPPLTSAMMSADVLTEEFQHMHQGAQGFAGFEAHGETSTEALLAELQMLQASMNMAGGSGQGEAHPPPGLGSTGLGLGSTVSGLGYKGMSGNFVRSFSGESDDVLGFTLDSPYSLDDLFMSPTPAPGALVKNTSGFSMLDVALMESTHSVSHTLQANRAVPSPLDLINRDFVSELYRPGPSNLHPNRPPHSDGLSPHTHFAPPQNSRLPPPHNVRNEPPQDERNPPPYGRSVSLGQAPTQPPPFQHGQKLFPSATFSGGGHARTPHSPDLPPPTPNSSEPKRSTPPASSSQGSDTPPDNSRVVSAAEIMEALRKLPSRASHAAQREALRSSPPVSGGDLPHPPKCWRESSLASSTCLEGVSAAPLFVQMSDEKLNSARNRALRGGYVAELEELRGWCVENLSKVVVENIPGVHFLACNALPAAHYRVARLMLSKMTLWLRQFQSNVRRISPVDLYMTIHEAARIFLDSDLSLLANIPSPEARTDFEKMYLVMEKMKKEACEQLRFSDIDLDPYKTDLDVKPRTLTPSLTHTEPGSGSGLSSDGSVGSGSGEIRESGFGRGNKRKTPPEGPDGLRKRLGFTNQLGNKGSEQQRQWLKGLQHELTKLNENEQVVAFNANPGGLAPVRRFVSEGALMAKYNLRMASWRLLAAASEKFDTLAKGALPSLDKYLGFAKYILGTCVGLTMAFCAIAGREVDAGKWEPKAEAVQSLLERTKKGMELAAELACIMTDLRTYEEDLLKLRVNAVGVMMREGGRSQQDAILLLEQRAETILTALVAEVTSPPANNPVLWTCWQLIFDFSRAQVALHVVDDLDGRVKSFFGLA